MSRFYIALSGSLEVTEEQFNFILGQEGAAHDEQHAGYCRRTEELVDGLSVQFCTPIVGPEAP